MQKRDVHLFVVREVAVNYLFGMQVVLEDLHQRVQAGSMPILTMELDWIQPSRHCLLCPQMTADSDTGAAYWFSLTFIGAFYKPDYDPYLTEVSSNHPDKYPFLNM